MTETTFQYQEPKAGFGIRIGVINFGFQYGEPKPGLNFGIGIGVINFGFNVYAATL